MSIQAPWIISIAYWERWCSGVQLSVVVPQAIGISFRNRIGDSAGEFLVVDLWGLIFLEFNVFELLFLSCFGVGTGGMYTWQSLIGVKYVSVYLFSLFYAPFSSCTRVYCLQSRIHAGFSGISAYTHGFTAHSHVYPGFYPFVEDSGLLGEF